MPLGRILWDQVPSGRFMHWGPTSARPDQLQPDPFSLPLPLFPAPSPFLALWSRWRMVFFFLKSFMIMEHYGLQFHTPRHIPLKLLSFFHLRPPNFCFLSLPPLLPPTLLRSLFFPACSQYLGSCVKPGGLDSRLAPPALSVGPEEAEPRKAPLSSPGPSSFNPAFPHKRS